MGITGYVAGMIHVGTSGWRYADWEGRFYPPGLSAEAHLRYYATRFATVEVNNTFYRLPDRGVFERWRRAVGPTFLMAVKASRFLTHVKRLKDPREPVARLLDQAGGLGEHLGPILVQLPPHFPRDTQRLEATLGAFPPETRVAMEFRDPSWLQPEVFTLLDRCGAALVWPDGPDHRPSLPLTGDLAYLRMHRGSKRSARYGKDQLHQLVDRVCELTAPEVFLYFNNDQGGAAIDDALQTVQLLIEGGRHDVASPPATGLSS